MSCAAVRVDVFVPCRYAAPKSVCAESLLAAADFADFRRRLFFHATPILPLPFRFDAYF